MTSAHGCVARVVIPFSNGNSATRGNQKNMDERKDHVVIPFSNGNSATLVVIAFGKDIPRCYKVVIPFSNGNSATCTAER